MLTLLSTVPICTLSVLHLTLNTGFDVCPIKFPWMAVNVWAITVDVFLIDFGGAFGTLLQTRLMDVADGVQGLAAAMNHAAFNIANALGPFLAGLAMSAGFGWTAPGWVGSLLALGGGLIWLISGAIERSQRRSVGKRRAITS